MPEFPLDSIPVFLKIEFLPDAAAAFGVDQTVEGTLGLPISDVLADIPVTYTDTLFQYHGVETVCVTREVGPFIICERVYGDGDPSQEGGPTPNAETAPAPAPAPGNEDLALDAAPDAAFALVDIDLGVIISD